jgi:hypothetical protein
VKQKDKELELKMMEKELEKAIDFYSNKLDEIWK